MSIRIDINVCRVCCKAEAPHSILQHATKFQYCTTLQISEHDGLPTKICDGCLGRMRVAVEFKRKSESSDRHLRSFIDKVNSQFHLALGGPSDDEEDICEEEVGKVVAEVASSEKVPMCVIPAKQEEGQHLRGAESEPKQELEKFRAVAVIQEKPATPPPPLVKPERDEVDIVELEYEDEMPMDEMEAEEQEQQEAEEELIYIDLPADYQQQQEEEELIQPMEESGHASVEVYEIHDSQSETLEIQQTTPKRRTPKTSRPKNSDSEKSTTSRFECTQCSKIFSTRTNLNRHLQTHGGNKPFTCLLCHKGFTQSGSLKQHLLIHQNLRPYVCSECGQGFTQPKSLTFHMRRHTNEKPFVCSYCGYAFRQKDGLKRHVAVKHDENRTRDFACDLCPKAFKTKHVLTVHRRKHCAGGGLSAGTDKEGEGERGSGEMVITVVGEVDE
uniref:Putative c2h2-type zn-finger protein n=1 Tax=Culex tarsalis TaxID=7177 RepID=A0A1Q3FWJ3_CULTA